MGNTLLKISNLSAGYDAGQVLNRIDLEIPKKSIVCLLGANGSGKTTTLRAISGMIWRQGRIFIDGKDISGLRTEQLVKVGISHVPEGRGTFLNLNVEENLLVGGYLAPTKKDARLRMEQVYGYFPRLKERRHQQAGTLSGGEQQMLAIGRTIMQAPKILLLDEPSFGLAPLIVNELFEIITLISRSTEMSVLLVEQNAKLALEMSSLAYFIENGSIVMSGLSSDMEHSEDIKRVYFGAAD